MHTQGRHRKGLFMGSGEWFHACGALPKQPLDVRVLSERLPHDLHATTRRVGISHREPTWRAVEAASKCGVDPNPSERTVRERTDLPLPVAHQCDCLLPAQKR